MKRPACHLLLPIRLTYAVALTCALSVFIGGFWQLPARAAASKGWIFHQKSAIAGDYTIYLTDTSFKSVNKRSGITVIARAPSWKLTVQSDRSGKYFPVGADQYRGEFSTQVFSGHQQDLIRAHWKKIVTSKVAGADAVEYQMHQSYKGPTPAFNDRFEIEHFNGVTGATLYVMDHHNLPAPLARIVAQTYDLPTFPQFPLKLIITDMNGTEKTTLETSKIERVDIADSTFTFNSKYKLAKQEDEVYRDPTGKQVMEGCLDWMGAMDKPEKKNDRRKP